VTGGRGHEARREDPVVSVFRIRKMSLVAIQHTMKEMEETCEARMYMFMNVYETLGCFFGEHFLCEYLYTVELIIKKQQWRHHRCCRVVFE